MQEPCTPDQRPAIRRQYLKIVPQPLLATQVAVQGHHDVAEGRAEMVGDGGKAHLRAADSKGRKDMGDQWRGTAASFLSVLALHRDPPPALRRRRQP
jgi:hypothetical protein